MFKVGDKVVRTIGHNVVFEVSGGCIGGRNVNARKNGEVYTDYISTTKGMPHHKSQLRHATQEEIAAGHRIDHFVDINDSHLPLGDRGNQNLTTALEQFFEEISLDLNVEEFCSQFS